MATDIISQEILMAKIRVHRSLNTLDLVCKTWKMTNKKELGKLLDLKKRVERHWRERCLSL